MREFQASVLTDAIPAFICIAAMPLMYSISEGICMGIISYVVLNLICGKKKNINVGMILLAILFVVKYFLI